MTTPPGPSRAAAVLWIVLPAIVLVTHFAFRSTAAPPEELAPDARLRIEREFRARIEQAESLTRNALERSPWAAAEEATSPWLKTLEGVGHWHGQPAFYPWQGSPPAPDDPERPAAGPGVRLRTDGDTVRLQVRAGPNLLGITAHAGFRIGRLDRLAESPWIPAAPGGRWTRVRPAGSGLDSGSVLLRGPDGRALLAADWSGTPPGVAAREIRRTIRAVCTVLWLLLGGFLWKRRRARFTAGVRPWIEAGAILFARQLIEWGRVSDTLLPESLGRAAWFGSSALGHWLDAPADLLWTAVAFAWAAERLRAGSRSLPRPLGRTVRIAVAVLLAAGGLLLPSIFAADTPIDVLDWDDARPRAVAAVLWAAWATLGVAVAFAIVDALGRGGLPPRRWVAAVLVPWTFVGATLYERALEEDARVRAESRVLPQLEDPSAERRWALESSLESAVRASDPGSADAFRLWSRSELGRRGYRSSLAVVDPDGDVASFFSHGLGTFRDPPGDAEPPDRLETLDEGTDAREVRHMEIAWPDAGGAASGWRLVGHVLEAADNLPFLAEESAFARALHGPGERVRSETSYVLYDRRGEVLAQTVDRAPPYSRELDLAVTRGRELDLRVGSDRYRAIPRLDDDKVHLLLLRRRSAIGRAARALRLTIASLAILLLVAPVGRTRTPRRGWTRWQGSFYRKLLTTLLAASIPPLLGLVFLVQGFLERRAEAEFRQAGVQAVTTAQRGIESLLSLGDEPGPAAPLDDGVLDWLSRLAGRPIHVWRDGRLEASSEREWFDSGLLPEQLPGRVHEEIVLGGSPFALHALPIADRPLQAAFAPLRGTGGDARRIVGVPLEESRRAADRTLDRVGEAMLLSAAGLVALLAFAAAALARAVSRPVQTLVAASGRLAAGDYSARASSPARDELGELVTSFNVMAGALQEQRVDLERRREYIETLLTHATTGIASVDRNGDLVTANPALHRILGLDPGALAPGQRWPERLEQLGIDPGLRETLRRRPEPWLDAAEVDLQSAAEGRRLRVVQVRLPAPSGEGDRLILVDDLTDLMRSNQLEAWAEMARAIAHEIKNPLTPIQLSTEHLRRRLTDRGLLPDDDLDRCLETVLKQVEGLREIAGEFGAYAKIPALSLADDDADAVLREAIEPYRRSPPPGIDVTFEADATTPVRLDRKAFVRALVNLIENALQAMPEGGTLTASCTRAGERVAYRIADDGIGIDEATRRRLYEPYFSTKSSGTGLGLAIVRRTVEAHGGTIDVESRPGEGSAFTILLPAAGGR